MHVHKLNSLIKHCVNRERFFSGKDVDDISVVDGPQTTNNVM